jgi:hypothetical protein
MTNNSQPTDDPLGVPPRSEGKGPGFLDERERRLDMAYEWCLHDAEVQRRYHGKVVVAQQGTIWGWGNNHAEAWEMARGQADCPAPQELVFVVVPGLPAVARSS